MTKKAVFWYCLQNNTKGSTKKQGHHAQTPRGSYTFPSYSQIAGLLFLTLVSARLLAKAGSSGTANWSVSRQGLNQQRHQRLHSLQDTAWDT